MEQKILESVRKACPCECDVETLPTKQNFELVIVKYPEKAKSPTIYEDIAFVDGIRELHCKKILPLLVPVKSYRTIYRRGNQFVFYTSCPDVFLRFVWANGGKYGVSYKFDNTHKRHKYVGFCTDINALITYLATVKNVKF